MDSGDELGGYDPTTPRPPPAQKSVPRARQNSNRDAAGPSSKPTNTQAAKASSSKNTKEDAIVLDSEEDEADAAPPPAKKSRLAAIPATQTNGKGGKGRGKPKDSTLQQEKSNTMEVDGAPPVSSSEPPARLKPPRPTAKPPNKSQPLPRPRPNESDRVEALERENARLKKRLEDLTALHETIVKQVQESLQVRKTEPEQIIQDLTAQYEATIQAQEKLLEEQSKKLAQYGAAPQAGTSVQFFTRDAVDEEKKALEVKLRKYEDTIKEKDANIADLQQKQRELDQQLAYEIKLAEEYRTKNPPAAKANGGPRTAIQSSAADPLQAEVIKFYEDLSNVLITNVSMSQTPRYPQWPEFKAYTFMCTFTHIMEGASKDAVNPSLQFGISAVWLPKDSIDVNDMTPPKSKDELQAKCHYWPLNLDKETPQFKERLDFFSDSFLFSRDQLYTFMRTLSERLAGTQSDDETEDEVEELITPRKT